MDALSIDSLVKRFGNTTVINGMSFSVPEHSVFGFLGQNGAGKTTTMKMVLGLLKPDGGNIEVFGNPVTYGQTETNRMIGYLPDVPEFYGYMTSREYLKLCGEISGLTWSQIRERSDNLLELVGLQSNKKRISGFSRGMKQRLGIAQALLNEPKLLICDEPTSALDPVGRKEILDILFCVKGNTTVVFSTHILSDVERICDHVAILHNGKLALQGALEDIKAKHAHNQFQVEFSNKGDMAVFLSDTKVLPYLPMSQQNGFSVLFTLTDMKGAEHDIVSAFSRTNIVPLKFEVLEPSLESMFMEVTVVQ